MARVRCGRDRPKAYTKPWTVTLTQELKPDLELSEAFCDEEGLSALDEAAARGVAPDGNSRANP